MALGSHLITVRRLEKYINDVIGKKANLPDTNKTIIGNISQINSDLTDICTDTVNGRTYIKLMRESVTSDAAGAIYFNGKKNGSAVQLNATNCRLIIPTISGTKYVTLAPAFFNANNAWRGYLLEPGTANRMPNVSTTILYLAWLVDDDIESSI